MTTTRALGAGCMLLALALPAGAATMTVMLQERLGRDWAPEVLTWPFTATAEGRCLPESVRGRGPEGPVPAQLIEVQTWPGSAYVKSARLALRSGLRPLEKRTFEVAYGPQKAAPLASDLQVHPGNGQVEILTSRFGLRLLLGASTYTAITSGAT